MNWSKYPFLRLLLPLVAGIMLGELWRPVGIRAATLYVVLCALIVAMMLLSRALRSYRYRWTFGLLTLVSMLYLGWFRQQMAVEMSDTVIPNRKGDLVVARVVEPPVEKARSVKAVLEWNGRKGMAYFEKSDRSLSLEYGDLLCFAEEMEEVPPPLNPGEFDYQAYLRRQGVTGRWYLKEESWQALGVNEGNPLLRFAGRSRHKLLLALDRCGVTEDAFGVGAALLLGYDESLPAQVRQQYVAAGAMHVLCVSGMHVGVVYLLASSLLELLIKKKRMIRVKKLLLLVLVWSYALLTGLSPSVIRATLMISFLMVGSLLRRKGNTLNSIAASAFVMLVVNPNNLFSIGFQLSYAAVLGIVLLQRPIYNLLFVPNKLLDKAWEITAVSLAAQVATMPLTLFHFHQFTPYFWLSNLFLTPLSFVAIMTGMALLFVSWIPWVSTVVGKGVWGCLSLMNFLVSKIEQLPFSVVKGLYINKVELAMGLLLLGLFLAFLHFKRKRMLMEMLLVSCCFAFSLAYRSQSVARQERITFYALRKHTCLDLVIGTEHLVLCDEGLLEAPETIDYSLRGDWARCQLSGNPPCFTLSEPIDHPWAVKRGDLLSFQGRLLAFWGPSSRHAGAPTARPVDMVLVHGKQDANLEAMVQRYPTSLLLIDGSVPSYLAQKWQSQAAEKGIPYINIGEGAWSLDLRQ